MGTYPSVYYRTNEVKVLPTMFSNKYSENDLDVFVLMHYWAFLCRKAELGGHGQPSGHTRGQTELCRKDHFFKTY